MSQYKKDRKKERMTLVKAFNQLDPEGSGTIGLAEWHGLMKVPWRPWIRLS